MNSLNLTRGIILVAVAFSAGFGAALLVRKTAPPEPVWSTKRRVVLPVESGPAPQRERNAPRIVEKKPATSGVDSMGMAVEVRRTGIYVLDTDVESVRQRMEERANRVMEANLGLRRAEYEELFTELGITDPAAQGQLLGHIGQIYRAKSLATQYGASLMNAQVALDNRMHGMLGEKYERFAAHEDAFRPQHESALIQQHLGGTEGGDLSDAEVAQLERWIAESGTFSMKTRGAIGSPMDPIPMPLSGRFAIPVLQAEQAALAAGASQVLAQARAAGMDGARIQAIEEYYKAQINQYEQQIEDSRDPAVGASRYVKQKLAAVRASASPDPAEIARLEEMLHTIQTTPPVSRRW